MRVAAVSGVYGRHVRCEGLWIGNLFADVGTGEGTRRRRSKTTRSRARGHEHLQLQTRHYCNGPQVEQTEWRNGVLGAEEGNDAMQCNA